MNWPYRGLTESWLSSAEHGNATSTSPDVLVRNREYQVPLRSLAVDPALWSWKSILEVLKCEDLNPEFGIPKP